jgi:hypothetical protein
LIWRTHQAIAENTTTKALFQNYATAQIAQILSGEEIYRFIPMGDQLREASNHITKETAKVIRELMQAKELPPEVLTVLLPLMPDIKALSE